MFKANWSGLARWAKRRTHRRLLMHLWSGQAGPVWRTRFFFFFFFFVPAHSNSLAPVASLPKPGAAILGRLLAPPPHDPP